MTTTEICCQQKIPCPLCGQAEHETFLEDLRDREIPAPETFRIVQCRHCGHRYLNPRPRAEDIGRYYRQGYLPFLDSNRSFTGRLMAWRARLWARGVARYTPPEGRVLEIGCASGRLLDALKVQGFSTLGLEPSDHAAGIARSKGHHVVVGNAEEVEWQENSVDTVVMLHVIEHLFDPGRVLEVVYRALKPGGRLVLALPNNESLAARIFGRCFAWDVPRHLHFFGPESMSRLLTQRGFELEARSWGLLPIDWVRGINYSLGGPHNWAGRMFAVQNPLWLALLAPLELSAAAAGLASRMTIQARKPLA